MSKAKESPYIRSVVNSPPISRRPVTININNPHNPAVAYPSAHISIDTKSEPSPRGFPVRMQGINSQDLVARLLRPDTSLLSPQPTPPSLFSSLPERANPIPSRANSAISQSDAETSTETELQAVKLSGKKRKRDTESDGEYEDNDHLSSTLEAAAATKSSKRSAPVTMPPKPPTKSNKGVYKTPAPTPGSAQSLLKRKAPGKSVPKTLEEADEADRMIWTWKHEGKGWGEIKAEWERITGKTPAKSTLSVRWIKLRDNFASNGSADDMLLIQYKNEVEKELQSELWKRVAQKVKANGLHDFKPSVLRKRYRALKGNNWSTGAILVTEDSGEDDEDLNRRENGEVERGDGHEVEQEDGDKGEQASTVTMGQASSEEAEEDAEGFKEMESLFDGLSSYGIESTGANDYSSDTGLAGSTAGDASEERELEQE